MSKKVVKTTQEEDEEAQGLQYHAVAQLRDMTPQEIKKLYDMIPSERQERYGQAYERALLEYGAKGSDEHEYQVIQGLLENYEAGQLVPVGMRYANPSPRVVEAAKNNIDLIAPEGQFETKKGGKGGGSDEGKPSPVAMIGFVVVSIGLVLFLIVRPMLAGKAPKAALGGPTETVTPTATLAISSTPTPLAIEDIDSVVSKGEAGGQSYPIKLTVQTLTQTQPVIYVVQRRAIKVADWKYSDDPGTASFISGLAVRPIIGIPFSDDNDALFKNMTVGTKFKIVTNTGSTLTFDYVSTQQVQRADTTIFRQTGPGIILILIGQRDVEKGQLTQYRTAVTASYNANQELSVDNVISDQAMQPLLQPTATITVTPTPIRRTTLNLIDVRTANDFVEIRARMINVRSEPITITGDMIWIVYGYAPQPSDPRVPSEKMNPFVLLPGQAADLDVFFKYTGNETYATIGIGDHDEWRFALKIK